MTNFSNQEKVQSREEEKKAKWLPAAKWIYWIVTIFFGGTMLIAGVLFLAGFSPNMDTIVQLGYPLYVLKILGTAKILGAIAILWGRFPGLKEWAYAGYSFCLAGAAASHLFSGDGAGKIMTPIIILLLVLMSYRQWKTGWI